MHINKIKCISSKLRNLKSEAVELYSKKNNLDAHLRTALKDLANAVCNREIVFCTSDKDGKIVIVNYADYNNIMVRERESFQKIDNCNENNIATVLDEIRKVGVDLVVELHKLGRIDDSLLKHITGKKRYGEKYKKNSRPHCQILFLQPTCLCISLV